MCKCFSPSLSALNFVSGDFIEQKCRHDGCFNISDSRGEEKWTDFEIFQTIVD